jgi:hypothetical protein
MHCVRAILAAALSVALVVATPLAAIASCLRCPPGCPMHAVSAPARPDPAVAHAGHDGHVDHAGGDGHAEHAGREEHGAHAAMEQGSLHAGTHHGRGDCHREARAARAPRPDDGPCIEAACGHHEPVIASVLPEAAVSAVAAPAPARAASHATIAALARLLAAALDPPSEPPRSSLG